MDMTTTHSLSQKRVRASKNKAVYDHDYHHFPFTEDGGCEGEGHTGLVFGLDMTTTPSLSQKRLRASKNKVVYDYDHHHFPFTEDGGD